jgi:hypothetical protein
LTEETVSRATTVAHLEQVAGERGSEIERLNGDITRVQEVSETRHGHIEHLKQMTAEQEAEIERLNGELVRLNEEAGAKTSHVAHLEQVAAERGVEIERLNGEVSRLTEETGSRATTVAHLEQVAGERGVEIERLEGEMSKKTEVLDRYIQESAQMARMIMNAEKEKEVRESEIAQLKSEMVMVSEDSQAKANHIVHLEQVAGERGSEVERISSELREKSENLDRYIQESVEMARMIIEAQDERDSWRRISVTAEIEEIIPGQRHEIGEHQHINYKLKGITHLGRKFSQLDVRIVEHRGNPGVLIMEPNAEERPFYAWEKHGEENGRGFMLIIPSDIKGEEWLIRATTNDVLLIKDIIIYIMKNEILNDKWYNLCKYNIIDLENIPTRVHYDNVIKSERNTSEIKAKVINPSINNKLIGDWAEVTILKKKVIDININNDLKIRTLENNYYKKIAKYISLEAGNILHHITK